MLIELGLVCEASTDGDTDLSKLVLIRYADSSFHAHYRAQMSPISVWSRMLAVPFRAGHVTPYDCT